MTATSTGGFSGPVPFDRLRAELLELYRPPTRAPRTFPKLRSVLDYLRDPLGVETTADLTPATVARFAARPSLRPTTIEGYLGYLRAACGYAFWAGYLARNPFSFRASWIRGRKAKARPRQKHHSKADIARVLDALHAGATDFAGQRLYVLGSVYAFAALRRDEALYLQAEDIDFDARIVQVGLHHPTKTPESAAPVPLASFLVELLRWWVGQVGGSGWLFANSADKPWTGGQYGTRPTEQLRRAGETVGVKGFTPQSLRHSFATHAESWGLSGLMVQRILRHSNRKTQELYRHAEIENMVEAMDSVRFD